MRNEGAKERLPFELRHGLVLTIEQSKGLEFDDVCLYDFVSDTDKRLDWRLLDELVGFDADGFDLNATGFDPATHLLLCEELKQLYVGMTRARKRCFIFDAGVERRTPLFDLLCGHGVAEKGAEQQLSVTATSAGKSSLDDWLRRGRNLLENKIFKQAELCFLKAGDKAQAFGAGALRLHQEAQLLAGGPRADKQRLAAIALLQCAAGLEDAAGSCGKYEDGARMLHLAAKSAAAGSEARRALLRDAGDVLAHYLHRHVDAAALYVLAASSAPLDGALWGKAAAALAKRAEGSDVQRMSAASASASLTKLRWLEKQASKGGEKVFEHYRYLQEHLDVDDIVWKS